MNDVTQGVRISEVGVGTMHELTVNGRKGIHVVIWYACVHEPVNK